MRRYLRLSFVLTAAVLAGSPAVEAQNYNPQTGRYQEMKIEDQPGYIPQSEEVPAAFRRQAVFFRTNEAPGTIVVHTSERFMYLVQGNNRALRYGIGVGRDGFQWSGLVKITRKAEWPDWTPPQEMIARDVGAPGLPVAHLLLADAERAAYLRLGEARIAPRLLDAPAEGDQSRS